MGDPARIIVKGDVAMHSWWFKQELYYEKEWNKKSKGKMWNPPQWVWDLAEDIKFSSWYMHIWASAVVKADS
jgi:hypothetical protein